jgi:hypothetical protein
VTAPYQQDQAFQLEEDIVCCGYGMDFAYTLVAIGASTRPGIFLIQTDGKIAYGIGGRWNNFS